MFGKLKARVKRGDDGGATTTAQPPVRSVRRYNSAVHRDAPTRDPREEDTGGADEDEGPRQLDSNDKSGVRTAAKLMKIIKKPVRNPREEMVAFNEGGEEDGRRQELFPLRAGAGRAIRHFSASAAQIREGENSSSPSPARFCSSVTQTTGERNLLSALLADPEMNDFGDDTRGSRINAGEASTLRRTKLAQDEKRRSKKKDSNHRDRKVTAREVPFWQGGANDATHQQEQDTQKEIFSRRDGRSSRRNGHSSGTKARRHLSPQKEILFSSLQDCVEGMGFDPADIETAIESTDAKSSADAARVVEWLAEHRDKLRGSSTGTALTADSNERVEELQESLKDSNHRDRKITEREVPFWRGSANDATHQQDTQKESSRRDCHSSRRNGHSSGTKARRRLSPQLTSSLRDCVKDMGFDPADIETAIESTDAKSSADAARVVEWLAEHRDKPRGSSTGTALTTDSDERVEEIQESLKELGFSADYIRRKKELYRRHSSKLGAEEFISAMLEVAASEDSSSSSDESSMEDFASPANISEIAEVTEADKRVLALDDSLRELGYCQELVKERQTSYRQYSNTMKPEDFISAMLEVEDGITATPARDVLPRPHGRG